MEVLEIDKNSRQLVVETVASIVFRANLKVADDNDARYIAIKAASGSKNVAREPHDIVKETRILASLSHPNIIPFLKSGQDRTSHLQEIWMPWIPYSLQDVLDSPYLSSAHIPPDLRHLVSPPDLGEISRQEVFQLVAKSMIYQLILAIDYLHSHETSPVAHRDIKPRNILLTPSGRVQLIDFGIAWQDWSNCDDLWPETSKMYFEVGSGPWRAPELLFGATSYDAFATDLWSLGAMIASFFTPLALVPGEDDIDEDADMFADDDVVSIESPSTPFIVPGTISMNFLRSARWVRQTLFNSNKGTIGLAWSIFRIRATPNKQNWPTFETLPDATRIQFVEVPAIEMLSLLPHLPEWVKPTGAKHTPPPECSSSPLDLIHRLLVYPPGDRYKSNECRAHSWFTEDSTVPIILPADHPLEDTLTQKTWKSYELQYWLKRTFMRTAFFH